MFLKSENIIHYLSAWSEQGFLNEVYRDQWFELSTTYNLFSYIYYENRVLWENLRPFTRNLHMTSYKPFYDDGVELGFENEITRLFYDKLDEMTLLWGSPYSLVTFLDCDQQYILAQSEQFAFSLTIIDLCTESPLGKTNSSSVRIFDFDPESSCSWRKKLEKIWDSTGKSLRKEAFVREFCKVDILRKLAIANPKLSYFTHWIEAEFLKNENIVNDINDWHDGLRKTLSSPNPLNLQSGRLLINSASNNFSCDLMSLGGTRRGLNDFATFFLDSFSFMGDWFAKTPEPTSAKLARCLLTGGGGLRKSADPNDKTLHVFVHYNHTSKYAPMNVTIKCFQNFCS